MQVEEGMRAAQTQRERQVAEMRARKEAILKEAEYHSNAYMGQVLAGDLMRWSDEC